jgi:lysyl-tRNA synthetase, class II
MGREKQIIDNRLRKIKELRELNINPYPYNFDKKNSTQELQKKYLDLKNNEVTKDIVLIAGRIIVKRDLGKISFATLRDGEGNIQVISQQGETSEKQREFFKKYVDVGDFVGVKGKIGKSVRGELSVIIEKVEILSKSILPLPEKFHGLKDKEERYRKRYLDLIMNPEVKEVFLKRKKIIKSIREYLDKKEFIEVETPYLQTIYGGAEARPFKTHLNALDIDLFLAISPELYLKRLIIGGFEKVYTIARNFRNEGIDKWHNPEFTMMEIYQAYTDYEDMMKLFEGIYEYVCKKVNGSTKIKVQGKEIDFKTPWKRMTMAEAIKKFAKIDVNKKSKEDLREICKKEKIEVKGDSWGNYVCVLFEEFCEDKIVQPTFIIDHPCESTPLCKGHRNDSECKLIERFEPFCLGTELGNAYSELNDPIKQEELLKEQQKRLGEGDEEANPYDEDFVNALKIGMPPTGGLGMGIDRMIILLTGQESIRDVLLFPFMKPEEKKNEKTNNKK